MAEEYCEGILYFISLAFNKQGSLQIPNHKHQISNNSQYPMTKKFNALLLYIKIRSCLKAMTLKRKLRHWNFEFVLLGFIWDLIVGAWDFMSN